LNSSWWGVFWVEVLWGNDTFGGVIHWLGDFSTSLCYGPRLGYEGRRNDLWYKAYLYFFAFGMEIQKDVSLLPYNTFRIDVKSKFFVNIESVDDLREIVMNDIFSEYPHFVLGGGSNVLLLHDFEGITLKNNILEKKIVFEDEEFVHVKVGWWENWHKFVQWTVEHNFLWVENLVYIPGSVGASPVQNIGAYGTEVKDAIAEVWGIQYWKVEKGWGTPLKTRQSLRNGFEGVVLKNEECEFGYRGSVFKKELKNKFFVTYLVFKLRKWKPWVEGQFNLSYGGIVRKMEELWWEEKDLNPVKITNMITEIRKSKLPDWEQIGTAWSFFKNPIVSKKKYEKLQKEFPNLLWFDTINWKKKLSAGQLLQVCGMKWKTEWNIWTYHNHALILVNHGGGTGQEVADFAVGLQKCVWEMYGVEIEPEVNYVG